MFVSVKLIESDYNYENNTQYNCFILEDTDFVIKLATEIDATAYSARGDASIIPSGLIAAYRSKNKNVAKNLAMFYLTSFGNIPLKEQARLIDCDFDWTAKYLPESECNKYKRCLLNQIKLFNYTGKAKHAQCFA